MSTETKDDQNGQPKALDPNTQVMVPFTFGEIEDLMTYLVNSNAGVQVFLGLDKKFAKVKENVESQEAKD